MGILVGGDEALFGNVGKALERTVDFDLDSMATLQVFQGFTMALLGPLWATLCSRGTMNRQTILAILTFGQGLVTLVMAFNMTDMWTMRLLRCLNGACLSGMMPVTFSIIADRFDDEVRGRMCALMNMAKGLGAAFSGMGYLEVAEYCTSEGRWSPCTYDDPCNESCSCGGLFGWQYTWIVYGVVAMAFAPLIFMLLKPPPITVKDSASGETELQKIRRLIGSTPTFAILVLQGCAGAMPWAVLYLRPFFFQTAEMSSRQTNIIVTTIQFLSIFGGGFSGWLSDTLARISERHGRIINAEFSVYVASSSAFSPSTQRFFQRRQNLPSTTSSLFRFSCRWLQVEFKEVQTFRFSARSPNPQIGRSSSPGRLRWKDASPHGDQFSPSSSLISSDTTRPAITSAPPPGQMIAETTRRRWGRLCCTPFVWDGQFAAFCTPLFTTSTRVTWSGYSSRGARSSKLAVPA